MEQLPAAAGLAVKLEHVEGAQAEQQTAQAGAA
jgi:hypothetical protein